MQYLPFMVVRITIITCNSPLSYILIVLLWLMSLSRILWSENLYYENSVLKCCTHDDFNTCSSHLILNLIPDIQLIKSVNSNLTIFLIVKIPEYKGFRRTYVCNVGDWFWSSVNIKGTNKDAKTLHRVLFCAHTLCRNYVSNTFLLVSSLVHSKQLLCFVYGQGQNRTKTYNKEIYRVS